MLFFRKRMLVDMMKVWVQFLSRDEIFSSMVDCVLLSFELSRVCRTHLVDADFMRLKLADAGYEI